MKDFIFSNIHLIIGFLFSVVLIIKGVILLTSREKSNRNYTNQQLLERFASTLSEEELNTFQSMNEQMQMNFMQTCLREMEQNQLNFTLEQMNFQQQEINRLMSTGIEFGGFNPDINLNPGMNMEQHNHMDNNNFGGPGGMF